MSVTGCTAELKEYLELVFTNDDGSTSSTRIMVDDTDQLYEATFYDENSSSYLSSVICKVEKIYSYAIKIKYFTGLDTQGLCPCAHKDVLLNYADVVTATIPINHIYSFAPYEIKEEEPPKPIPQIKEVTKVSVLGISSEFIHSVIVRLRIYEDGSCCEVTDTIPVDMTVGNKYNVTFVDHVDHTTYEIVGILKAIAIEQNFGDEAPNHGFVRNETGCSYHDMVGMNNVCYDPISTDDTVYDKDHFLSLAKSCPEKVLFTFDTSTDYNSTFDKVWLNDIRGVSVIEEDEVEIIEPDNPDSDTDTVLPPTGCTCPETCPYFCTGDKPSDSVDCWPGVMPPPPIVQEPPCPPPFYPVPPKPPAGDPPPPKPPRPTQTIEVGDLVFITKMDEDAGVLMKNPDGTSVPITLKELLEAYSAYAGLLDVDDSN